MDHQFLYIAGGGLVIAILAVTFAGLVAASPAVTPRPTPTLKGRADTDCPGLVCVADPGTSQGDISIAPAGNG